MTGRKRAGVLGLLGLLGACAPAAPALVDLAGLERPDRPNTYLVCPGGRTTAPVDREPPVYAVPRAELERTWLEALAREPRTRQVVAEPERHRYLYLQRTPLLRFPDLIQVEFLEAAGGASTLCLYSRSVYGYSDLGANRRRVEDWLGRITPAGAGAGDGAAPPSPAPPPPPHRR